MEKNYLQHSSVKQMIFSYEITLGNVYLLVILLKVSKYCMCCSCCLTTCSGISQFLIMRLSKYNAKKQTLMQSRATFTVNTVRRVVIRHLRGFCLYLQNRRYWNDEKGTILKLFNPFTLFSCKNLL